VDLGLITSMFPGFLFHTQAHFALFGELQFIHSLLRALRSDVSVQDGVPDLFAFTLSGPAGLQAAGATSQQLLAARAVVDAGIATLITELSSLYGNRIVGTVTVLPALAVSSVTDAVLPVFNSVLAKVWSAC